MAREKDDAFNNRKCITPKFRVSFASLFQMKTFRNPNGSETEPQYELTMLFDKRTDLKTLKRCVEHATIDKWGADKNKWPRNLRSPFRDGDEKDYDGYENTIYVKATSKKPVGLVDERRERILSEDKESGGFYNGCYARAQVFACAYDVSGNKGIKFVVFNVQKIADGEEFSGRQKAEDVFDAVDDDADDRDNYADDDRGSRSERTSRRDDDYRDRSDDEGDDYDARPAKRRANDDGRSRRSSGGPGF